MKVRVNCKEFLLPGLITRLATCFTVIGLLTSFYVAYSNIPKLTSSFNGNGLAVKCDKIQNERHRFAIVHLIDAFNPTYSAALLGSAQRMVQLHSNISKEVFSGTLDLVVMVPEGVNTTGYEHPYIRYVHFNRHAIDEALEGKNGGWGIATHWKLCAMNLEEYDKVVFIDLDILILSQLASILLDTTPPAMVQWGDYPTVDFNSGFHIFRPSQEMFHDAITALQNLGPAGLVLQELLNMSSVDSLQMNIPRDPTRWGGYRSDQEFLFAFYDILPQTRNKWGPIHPLPYRYNAREESLFIIAKLFLEQKANELPAPAQYNGAHLHLFGGFGHDGRGHRINHVPKEDGTFGLVAIHMTTRKPWQSRLFQGVTDNPVTNWTLTPMERCPYYINQVEFWETVLKGMAEAIVDTRYGYLWTDDSAFSFLQEHDLVKHCFLVELQALLSEKDNRESHPTCPDMTDCNNRHCRWRSAERSCNQTLPLLLSLIDNQLWFSLANRIVVTIRKVVARIPSSVRSNIKLWAF